MAFHIVYKTKAEALEYFDKNVMAFVKQVYPNLEMELE